MKGFNHALVTGGAGFIGSHLVQALLAQGKEVIVLDNLSVGKREAVPEGIRFILGDIRDSKAVREALEGVDCVFHLAAQVTIRGSFTRFYEDLDNNVMGTASLLKEIDASKVRWFVFASSMAVYEDAKGPIPVSEDHPTKPISPYGISKLTAEGISQLICKEKGIPLTILRYFNTFGPGQAYTPYVGVITIFITRLLHNEPPIIFGDGEQQRDFIHVEDIVAGTLAAPGRTPGIYNLGSGRGTSMNILAKMLIQKINPSHQPVYVPPHPGELRFSIADITTARKTLGFFPTRNLEDSLDEVIEEIKRRIQQQ